MQKIPATSSEPRDSDKEMGSSFGGLVELSETTKAFLEASKPFVEVHGGG